MFDIKKNDVLICEHCHRAYLILKDDFIFCGFCGFGEAIWAESSAAAKRFVEECIVENDIRMIEAFATLVFLTGVRLDDVFAINQQLKHDKHTFIKSFLCIGLLMLPEKHRELFDSIEEIWGHEVPMKLCKKCLKLSTVETCHCRWCGKKF